MYPQEKTTVRIDGVEYDVGSAEASYAQSLRKGRMDAALIKARTDDGTIARLTRRLDLLDRFDANGTAFLARDLVFVRAEIERMVYERIRGAEFVPVDTSIPRGAQTVATRIMDRRGEARIGHSLAGDLPRADVSIEEDQIKLTNVVGSYGWDLGEMEAAAFAKVPLSRFKAEACAEMIARGLDKVCRIGDSTLGLTGFFNHASVPTITLTNGEWLTATVAEIIADLRQIEAAIITQSRDEYAVDEMILPTAYEGLLRTTPINGDVGAPSIATWFFGGPGYAGNSRMLRKLTRWIALDDATGTDVGVDDPPMGIVYRKDLSILRWPVPIMYEEEPPQVRGFEWVVPARGRCSGVEVRRPLAMGYIENLD